MNRKLDAALDGLVAGAFIAVIAAICLTAGDYVALLAGERLLENLSILPIGWGDAHRGVLGILAFALAVVPAGFVGWLIFRGARDHAEDARD